MRKDRVLKFRFVLVMSMGLLCTCAVAQEHFRYKAALDTVLHGGFYSIPLSPSIVANCQYSLGDIRIKDESGKEVPYYILHARQPVSDPVIFGLPLLKTTNPAKIVVKNESGTGTNELHLSIKNSAATRTVTLSGSDDTSHWYVIKENILLTNTDDADENDKTFFNQTIQFPFNNYRYFRISMQGKDSLPLNIFGVGIASPVISGRNIPSSDIIPAPVISQYDSSNKKSYIRLQFNNYYQIDHLKFALKGAKFFNRSFNLYSGNITTNTLLLSGEISSRTGSAIVDPRVKASSLLLVIDNYDNPPLQIDTLLAYQLPASLITYLDAGKKYKLFFGDSTLQAPTYDLDYFLDSFRNNGSIAIAVRNMEQIIAPARLKDSRDGHLQTWLLWSIIIAVLLLLIYFSYTLLKDINRKTTNTDAHL